MDLNQKNVVYVGGCGGIGTATCRLLVQKNIANLAILDLAENEELIKELRLVNSSTNVFFLKIDIRSKENIEKILNDVVARIGHIDILVNGVGVFNEVDAEITIGVNLLGLIHSTMAALPLMDKSKGNRGGLIVNIASVAGLDPCPHSPVYCASKSGVVLFTRSLAVEVNYQLSGVSFVTICPGITKTPLLDQFTAEDKTPHAGIITNVFNVVKNQTPEECAQSLLQAIEINKNGAVYVCDVGRVKEIFIPKFWDVQKLDQLNIL